jgi:acetyltransferase
VRPGGLSLLVQSGNMALTLMNEATAKSWEGISMCIGLGNEADLGFAEALDYLGADEDTRCVVIYAEGIENPRAFLGVAAHVTRAKPVVMVKAARSERGALTAGSHTGAVAGPYDRLSAGMAQAGIVELRRTDEILHVAETLANQPACAPSKGIALLSDGGGQGTFAVDALGDMGATLAELSDQTRTALRALLGRAAAVGNPVDLAGAADADPMVFAGALDLLAADDAVGAVLVIGLFGGYGIRFAEQLQKGETAAGAAMADRMRSARKGLVVHSMYASHRSPPLGALGARGVPVVESLDTACRCVAELQRRGTRIARDASGAWRAELPTPEAPAAGVRAARDEGRVVLAEPDARSLLATYGARFAEAVVARNAEEAATALARLGAPVALKLVSHRIVHKTDAGGVALGLSTADEARRAFEAVAERARAWLAERGLPAEPPAALVTRMAERPLVELLVGARRDPGLGPVLTVGGGGVWVEALRDVAHGVLPLGRDGVADMLGRLRIAPLLRGTRGAPAVDLDAVIDAALAVATCVERQGDVAEVEINPLFAYADRVEPIDARVILAPTS